MLEKKNQRDDLQAGDHTERRSAQAIDRKDRVLGIQAAHEQSQTNNTTTRLDCLANICEPGGPQHLVETGAFVFLHQPGFGG